MPQPQNSPPTPPMNSAFPNKLRTLPPTRNPFPISNLLPSPHLRTPPQFKTHNPNLRTPPPTLEPTTSELRLPNYQNQPSTSENLAFKHRTPFHHQPKNSVSNLRSTPASELCPNLKPRPPT